MMPLCEPYNVDYGFGSPPAIARYGSGLGLRIDPLIAMGPQIYGQLWDAHFYTLPAALDSTVTLTDIDDLGQTLTAKWLAWNFNTPVAPVGRTGNGPRNLVSYARFFNSNIGQHSFLTCP